jgi:hypothetical protein
MNATEKASRLQEAWEKMLEHRRKSRQKFIEALNLTEPKHYDGDYALMETILNDASVLDEEADFLWTGAVLQICGDVKIEWCNRRKVTLDGTKVPTAHMEIDVEDCTVEGVTYTHKD